jgi:hypothetical protein
MGNTFKTGNYVNGIFQDTSNNIGIGAAPSGTYKFEITGTSKVSGVLTLGATLSNGTYTYTLPAATGTLALVGGAGVGTVTSVAALTIGTTGTDLSSSVANSTTTPVITLNVPTASAANRGALSSADWTTFNSKQGTITLTTTGTSGAATFTSNTLNIPNYGSALSGYLPLSGGTLTGALIGTTGTFNGNLTNTSSNFQTYGSTSFGASTWGLSIGNGGASANYYRANDHYFQNGAGTQTLQLSSAGALGGTSATFSTEVTSSGGQGRFGGWATGAGYQGAALEVGVTGGVATLIGYNRTTSVYIPITISSGTQTTIIDGNTILLKNNSVTALTIASTGAATFSSSVAINGAAGNAPLHILGANQTNGTVQLEPNAAKGAFSSYIHYGTNGDWYIRSASASGFVSINDTGGNVLIGTTTDDTVNKLQVTGSAKVSTRIIVGETVGKNGSSGTFANNTTQTINPNGFGGNLSAGYIVCCSSVNSGSFNSVIILSQIHTNYANIYTVISTQNDNAGVVTSFTGGAIQIVNTSGYTVKYNCRYINFCDENTWNNGY